MTDINQIGELAAAKVKSIARTKANLDERSKLAAEELSQVVDALKRKQIVNGCRTIKEWCAKWKISDRMVRYILRGRKPRTGEHRNRAVPIKPGMVISIGKRKFTLVWVGDSSDHTVDEDGINNYGNIIGDEYDCDVTLKMVEIDRKPKEAKPAPKKQVKNYSTKVPSGDFVTFPAKPKKTHKMRDGKRTWCGKILGDTLAAEAKMSDSPTCRQCQNGEENAKLREEYASVLHPAASVVGKRNPVTGGIATEEQAQRYRVRHIQQGKTAITLCGVFFNSKYGATKQHPANCKKCLKLQTQPETKEPTEKELRKRLNKLVKESRDLSYEGERIADYLELDDEQQRALYPDLNDEKVDAQQERADQMVKEMTAITAKLKAMQMSEPAKALAAAVDGAANPLAKLPKADREWLEKAAADHREGKPRFSACPDREPEDESLNDPRRHFPTDEEREQRELLNECGNLDGDDGNEEEEAL